jgi:AcrR family transcriptional regulator
MNQIKIPWIQVGYELFSKEGPKGLKVETIAKAVKKSKSSFYHHFSDLEVFTELLLVHHLERVKIIADQERQCKNVMPELLYLILEIKQDLLFNRQLRIHRNNPAFKQCFETASLIVSQAITTIWSEMLGLSDNSNLAGIVLNLSLDNFYLQLTEETLTYDWLNNYMNELKAMVKAFEKNKASSVR